MQTKYTVLAIVGTIAVMIGLCWVLGPGMAVS
jgi:hypothetical protein